MDVQKLMLVALAGWINQQQEDVIEYLREEVRVLKELQGKKRLRFNDEQRRLLARKAKLTGAGGTRRLLLRPRSVQKLDYNRMRWFPIC